MRPFLLFCLVFMIPLALLALSQHWLLATATPKTLYTASADHVLAVPAIANHDGWQTTLQIQNAGNQPTSARIVFYGQTPAACPATPQPLATRCVGPIPAGGLATFLVSQDPHLAQARSARVYSAQPTATGCDTPAGQPLAVVVQRTRTDPLDPTRLSFSNYTAIAPAVAGFWDSQQQAYVSVVPWTDISDTQKMLLHLQNTGLHCATEITLEMIVGETCLPAQRTLSHLAPGTATTIELNASQHGTAGQSIWIRSPQPLAIVVDRWLTNDVLLASHATGYAVTAPLLDAPLVQHWPDQQHTKIWAQNASTHFTSLVRTIFRGTVITPTQVTRLVCPGGGFAMDTNATTGLSPAFTGTVSLQSAPLGQGQPETPALAADVALIQPAGAAGYHVPHRITGTHPLPLVNLPWLARAYHPDTMPAGVTVTSQIAVLNQSETGPGFMQLLFYDRTGNRTTYQPGSLLAPQSVAYIDLADVVVLPAAWQGSAVLQFFSTARDVGVSVAVLQTASGATGDTLAAYAGLVSQVQPQPSPIPSPTPAPTATPSFAPPPGPTRTPQNLEAPSMLHLPLIRRSRTR